MSVEIGIQNLGWFADVIQIAKEKACTDIYILEGKPVRLGLLKGYYPLEPTLTPTREQIDQLRDSTMPSPILAPSASFEQKGSYQDMRIASNLNSMMRAGGIEYCFAVTGFGRFRVSLSKSEEGVGMSIRKLPFYIPSFDDLNPYGFLDGLKRSLNFHSRVPSGLILHAGITGSGKTTLIASEVDMIAQRSNGSILTFENPIEYRYTFQKALIRQYEIGRHIDSYVSALRMSLRNDPSVIVLGEVRTKDEIHALIDTAMRGHLCFSTVHTSSVMNTLRFLDGMGDDMGFKGTSANSWRQMLAHSLLAVVAQKLIYKDGVGFCIVPEVLIPDDVTKTKIANGEFRELEQHFETGGIKEKDRCVTLTKALDELRMNGVLTDREKSELLGGKRM